MASTSWPLALHVALRPLYGQEVSMLQHLAISSTQPAVYAFRAITEAQGQQGSMAVTQARHNSDHPAMQRAMMVASK
ncbi:hypothetical protein L7F22_037954, partial [Adiantum nelumboides]|nr:hypothetical protein [Adiantum nelumboides]